MDHQREQIPVDDIINVIVDKKFKKIGQNGYSDTEVDAFLDDICDAVEKLQREKEILRQQTNEAQVAQKNMELKLQTATQELEALKAQRSYMPPIARAAEIPAAAPAQDNGEAGELLSMAKQLKATLAAAQEQPENQLVDLSGQRNALQNQVNTLQNTVKEYKEQLASLVAKTQELLAQ